MTPAQSHSTRGAVAALVVATAPDAAPETADLLWRAVAGRPLVSWPLQALLSLEDLGYCALVAPYDHYDDGLKVIESDLNRAPTRIKPVVTATGHAWRRAFANIEGIPTSCEWLIVVDATLPLVTTESLRDGLRTAAITGVAIAGEPVKETLKRVDGSRVVETLPRDSLRHLFSPVVFRHEAMWRLLDNYDPATTQANDLLGLLTLTDVPLYVSYAGYPAVRVTSEDDLAIVETLLRQRESEASPS